MLAKILRQHNACFAAYKSSRPFSTSPAHLFHLYQPCTNKELNNPPKLIVLHGVLGSSKNFRGITHNQKIASKVDTYLLDMRNHGKSEHRDSMSYTEMADDVYNFIVENKLENTRNILLGHSMGARIAMEVSARHPQIVQGAIIVDLAPYNYYEDENFDFIDAMESQLEKVAKIDITKDIHQVKKEIMYAAMNREVGEVIATNLVPDGHGGHKWRINLQAIHKNFRNQILHTEYLGDDKYYGHARIILGAQSEYTSPDIVHSFAKVFPNLDLHHDVFFISDAGHWVHYSKPHEFIDLVSEFIDKAIDQ